jgi:hypothetical protein
MILIIESSDQQAVEAIAAVAKALKVQVQLRDDVTPTSEAKAQTSRKTKSDVSAKAVKSNKRRIRDQKWFEVTKFSTKHFKFNREEANAR